jgi:hypothetical protein
MFTFHLAFLPALPYIWAIIIIIIIIIIIYFVLGCKELQLDMSTNNSFT